MTTEKTSAAGPLPGHRSDLGQVIRLSLKLGCTAFGGPAAHIAMLRDEVVQRRKWLDDQRFLDLVGATNLIPGPNSTEMFIHIGFLRAGWPGLIAGGASFILPAMLSVLALAWAYVRFETTPAADWLLYGVKPVVVVVIGQALWMLGRKAVKGLLTAGVGLATLALSFAGGDELGLMLVGGLTVMLVQNWRLLRRERTAGVFGPGLVGLLPGLWPSLAAVPFRLSLLFFTFLKIGAVLYGSGYVLLAFLRSALVVETGWLTDQQLIDAVAVGQVTPGPVFTTATFVGYVLGGLPGALLATLGIFLPSFVFVAVSNPIVPRLRESPWASGLLDGVNVAALGLMATVTWQLGRAALIDPLTLVLALAAAVLLFRFRVHSAWLVLGGAAVGLVRAAVL